MNRGRVFSWESKKGSEEKKKKSREERRRKSSKRRPEKGRDWRKNGLGKLKKGGIEVAGIHCLFSLSPFFGPWRNCESQS